MAMQKDSWSCYACVAVLITGDTLQDVYDTVGHDGSEIVEWATHPKGHRGFTMGEINYYLATRFFTTGVIGIKIHGFDGKFVKKYSAIEMHIPTDMQAIILVESTMIGGHHHCLYWDGEKAFDPYYDKPIDLCDYKLAEWWPVVELEDQGEPDRFKHKHDHKGAP